jgi:anti-sigma B factor antagonist
VSSHPVEATSFRPLLTAELQVQGTTCTVAVAGEMDISSADQVRNVIDRGIGERPETLLLDLSELEFCDSTGIHLVIRSQRRATAGGIRFVVIPPTGLARRVFDLSGIAGHVPFVASSAEA